MVSRYNLRTELRNIMLTVCDHVYYEIAPDDSPYPYIVFELQDLTHNYGKTLVELEINVIDYETSTASKETICDQLQALFNKADIMTAYYYLKVYRGLRQPVEEEDRMVRRSRMTFELHLHERRDE